MKNADLPAAALTGDAYQDFAAYDGTNKASYNPECQGLTKREMISIHAMQAMLSSKYFSEFNESSDGTNTDLCAKAVNYADALLKELEK